MKIIVFLFLLFSLSSGQYRIVEIDAIIPYFDSDGDNTVQTIKSTPGLLIMIEIQNLNLADAWIQLYDASSPSVGSTTPNFSFHIPGGDGGSYYGSKIVYFQFPGVLFLNAIKYACTTTPTGSGDPTNGLIVNAEYFND